MLRPHERLVWTHYAFHVNNAKQCSLQPSDDGHEPHVGGQGHFPQWHLRRKRPPNAVNGGALLPVLVVRIPTSANMLNTCTALSKHVGLRSTTSSQPMVYAPMHALFALSLTITSLTRPRVITRRARCESNRSCACAFTGLAAGRGRGPLPAPFRLLPPRRPSTRQKAADIESAGPPHTRVIPTRPHPHALCTRMLAHASTTPLAAAHRSFPHMRPTLSLTSTLPSPNPNQSRRGI